MEEKFIAVDIDSPPFEKTLYNENKIVGYVLDRTDESAFKQDTLGLKNKLDIVKSIIDDVSKKNIEFPDLDVLENENRIKQVINEIVDDEGYPLDNLPEELRKTIILARQSKQNNPQKFSSKSK